MKNYKITIIIPVAEDENYDQSLTAIKQLNYHSSGIEIIIVHGNQPSKQRNIAAKKAKGDILYFLDNDSIPGENNLQIINEFFRENKNAAVIGGPALNKKDDTTFQKAESAAFGSFIGSSFSRSRYSRIGTLRESSELELILCNMAIRKDIFLKLNGFNTNLYPNEENELLNRIQKRKGLSNNAANKICYHPDLVIYRSQRKNLFQFIKQILTYGRGRGEQTTVHISNLTVFPLVSLALDSYIVWLLIIYCTCILLPGLIYAGIIIITSIFKTIQHKNILFLFYLPVIYFIIHTLYGIGFLYGIIKSLFKIKTKKKEFWYKIEKVKCIKWIKKIK